MDSLPDAPSRARRTPALPRAARAALTLGLCPAILAQGACARGPLQGALTPYRPIRESATVAVGAGSAPRTASVGPVEESSLAVRDEDSPAGGAQVARSSAAAPAPSEAPASAQQPAPPQGPAQRERAWQEATARDHAVRLAIGDRETLPLRGMQVRAQIEGFRARIVMDAYFFNDRGRAYEGTFQLKLPEGASPYYFAFGESTWSAPDPRQASIPFFPAPSAQGIGLTPEELSRQRAPTWSAPREARVVPRERAAHAYTETVRARVDPALMEWSGAGVFEARVFPLTNQRLHRIVVAYDVTLDREGDAHILPINLPRETDEVILDVAVATGAGAQASLTPSAPARREDGYARYRFDHPRDRAVRVAVRGPSPTLVGSDGGPESYFAAQLTARIPAAPELAPADRAVFLLDTSLSSEPALFSRRLQLLERVLTDNRSTLRQFAVQLFDVAPRWWRPGFVENTPENVAALLATAREQSLQGATDLGAALASAARPAFASSADRWDTFLLSDAAVTWGEADVRRIAADFHGAARGRLFAYRFTGAGGGDESTMASLVRDGDGAVFTVADEQDVARAASAHRARPWRLRGVTLDGATDVMIAGAPSTIFDAQRLFVVGRGRPAPNAQLRLDLSQGAGRAEVNLPLGPTLSSALAPRAFGETAVALLEDKAPVTERQARAFAMHFRVTGRACSLVMLEREEDYQRFGIVPADDARTVRETRVREALEGARDGVARVARDPREAFLAWLDRLGQTPGVTIRVRPEVRAMLAQAPASAFEIPSEPLAVERTRSSEVSDALRQHLAQTELDYDMITTEAERLRAQRARGEGLRALSSLVERRPGDTVLARDVAFTVSEWGLPVSAFHLLRRVQSLRPSESHTYRSLAESLAAMGRNELALALYDLSVESEWDARSRDFRAISAVGYLRFLREIARGSRRVADPALATRRLAEVRAVLPTLSQSGQMPIPVRADLLVMIAWSTDNTDVDLHVVDPANEECYFGHRQTATGGYLTQDVTTGYGPEMFVQPQASPGTFRVFAHFYGSNRNRASARTRVLATVVKRWGTDQEEVVTRAITLGDTGARQDIELVRWPQ
jgi:hypothetical protein